MHKLDRTHPGSILLSLAIVGMTVSAVWGGQSPPQGNASTAIPKYDHFLSLKSRTLFGDFQGERVKLEDSGVRINVFLNDQFQSIVKGGLDTDGAGRNSASMDALLSFDLGKLAGIESGEALLHLQSNWGGGVNGRSGALFQVNDDADGTIDFHVAQFWYRHHFSVWRSSLTVGYLDYQTIVDRNAFANSEDKQFMHQTLDNNPFIPLRIGMGAALSVKPTDWYTLIIGLADGQAVPYKGGIAKAFHEEAWYTTYLENGFSVKLPSKSGDLPGNYRFGAFYDPGPRSNFPRWERDNRTQAGDYGFYASLDQKVFRESKDDDQGLGVFARFGYRSPETNKYSHFWSGGVVYQGLLPGRDHDVLGAAFSLVRASHLFHERIDDAVDSETVYELYYALQVSKWLVVTPDVQYIDNPGANHERNHAIAAGVRVRVSF